MARGANLPPRGVARPHEALLPEGTSLYRVHSRSFDSHEFNTRPQDHHFGGNRFGSTANDRYSYLYAAPQRITALTETLVRAVPFDDKPGRLLPREAIDNRRLSHVVPARDLRLVSLFSTPDLAGVQQHDNWLVESDPAEYAFTRRWAHWVRGEAPWADGFVWMSHWNRPSRSLVLFGSPHGDRDTVRPGAEPWIDLDSDDGVHWLNETLAHYRVQVGPSASPGGA